MGTPAIGASSALAIDDSAVSQISDFDSGSFRYEFVSESLARRQTHVETFGIRGTRSREADRVRIARERIAGQLILYPTPVELDQWLPRILGGAEASDVFALAESLPEFGMLIDRVTKRFLYTGCRVAKAVFSGASGQLIKLTLDLEGETELLSGTSFPATIPAIDGGQPYLFSDCTFSLAADASATEAREFEITIDNRLDVDRYMNSVTRGQLVATDRLITLKMIVPYTVDEVDLHAQAIAGAAGSLTLTNGSKSCQFAFGNLKSPAQSPNVAGHEEILLALNLVAYKSGGVNELIVTNDST